MRTALVAGATGLIGKHCIYRLLESPEYTRVIALTRKPLTIKHHKLHQVMVDFDNLDAVKEELIADDVFCCLGTTIKVAGSQENFKKVDFGYPLKLAQLCQQQGARQYLLVSAMGANSQSSIFYSRVKGELENAISGLHYNSFQVFRPSLLMGDRKEVRIGEIIGKVLMKATGFLFIGPLKKYKAIQGETVAKVMVKAALMKTSGKRIWLNDEMIETASANV